MACLQQSASHKTGLLLLVIMVITIMDIIMNMILIYYMSLFCHYAIRSTLYIFTSDIVNK